MKNIKPSRTLLLNTLLLPPMSLSALVLASVSLISLSLNSLPLDSFADSVGTQLSVPARSRSGESQLQFTWLGVAGIFLTDGQSQIFFDPVFAFPTLKHWIFGSELKSNPEQVQEILQQFHINPKLETALFVSHTHFDHASDYQEVAKQTNGQVYGGPSLRTMTQAPIKFQLMKKGDVIRIGKFEVTPYSHVHARILSLFRFLFGPVREPFTGGFYEFREGETWGFIIKHGARRLIFDQSSRLDEDYLKYKGQINTYFVGVNNRVSTADLVQNTIGRVEPSQVVPLHFDFFPLEYFKESRFPFIDLEGVETQLRIEYPKTKWIMPRKFSLTPLQD